MKAIIILGSARSDGNTFMICTYLNQQFDLDFCNLNDYNIGYYDYAHQQNDDFFPLMEKLIQYDTFILATPVYWYSMSAQMKTFLDRFTDLLKIRKDLGRQLRTKRMKVICCSSDQEEYPEFWKPFERSAEYLGMHYAGNVHTWIAEGQIPAKVKNRLKQLFL